MMLYSKVSATPSALPFMDTDAEGNLWTNLANNPDGRLACGWVDAPAAPAFDPDAETLAWRDGAWAVDDRPAEEIAAEVEQYRAARIADLATLRWNQQQYFSWNGQTMPADDVTIGRISAKVAILDKRGAAPDTSFTWKPAPATFVPLTYDQLLDYGDAIDVHIQLCFDREEALCGELLAAPADRAAIAAVDIDAGWPE